MAKMIKRTLAMLTALAIVATQLAIPALAAEEETTQPQATMEVTLEATAAAPQEPVVNTDTNVDVVYNPDGKTTTTETNTQTFDPNTGVSTNKTETVVVTEKKEGNVDTEQTNWDSEERVQRPTQYPPVTENEGSPIEGSTVTTVVKGDVVTNVKGKETVTETRTHTSENSTHVEGAIQGNETTNIVDTTVTTVTTTGQLLDTGKDEDQQDKESSELDIPSAKANETSEWAEGEVTGQWGQGKLETGDLPELPVPQDSDPEIVTPDAPNGITITMSPDGKWVTEYFDITLEDVSSGKFKMPTGRESQPYTVTEIYDENNEHVGYRVSRVREARRPDPDSSVVKPAEGQENWTQQGDITPQYVDPGTFQEGTVVNGNETIITEAIYDTATGAFMGYRVTTILKEVAEPVIKDLSQPVAPGTDPDLVPDLNRPTTSTDGKETFDSFTLPQKPAKSETDNDDGTKTVVTVENLVENGRHVGFTTYTDTTDAQGNLVRRERVNIYGTTTTKEVDTVADPTHERWVTTTTTTTVQDFFSVKNTRNMAQDQVRVDTYTTDVTTETDTFMLMSTEDSMYFLLNGRMYVVTDQQGKPVNNLQVATPNTVPLGSGSYPGDSDLLFGSGYTGSDLNTNYKNGVKLNGYGLYSNFKVKDTGGTSHSTKQYELFDGKNSYFVYCVELNTDISSNPDMIYSPDKLSSGESVNSSTEQKIRAVAVNGFWGTANGLGSLQAVKDLLIRQGHKTAADNLTPGIALAATQAAMWNYGKNGSATIDMDSLYTIHGTITETEKQTIQTLRNVLVNLAEQNSSNQSNQVAETIRASDITSSSVTLNHKVTNADGTDKMVGESNVYNADVAFQVAVNTSSFNGDLIMTLSHGGKAIGKYRLAGNDDPNNLFEEKILKRITPDASGNFKIEGVELTEGVEVTLNISGTQHLDDGIFVYRDNGLIGVNWQDLVGMTKKEQSVNVTVGLEFNVHEPQVEHQNVTQEQERQDTMTYTRKARRTDSQIVNTTSGTKEVVRDHDIDVYGTVTVTTTERKYTRESRDWEEYYSYDETTDTGTGRGDLQADPPKTGDLTLIWAAISCLSLCGAAVLGMKKKEA